MTRLDNILNQHPDREREAALKVLIQRTSPINREVEALIDRSGALSKAVEAHQLTVVQSLIEDVSRRLNTLNHRFHEAPLHRAMAVDLALAQGVTPPDHVMSVIDELRLDSEPTILVGLGVTISDAAFPEYTILSEAAAHLRRAHATVDPGSLWTIAASDALVELAMPVFQRSTALSRETAEAVRFAALVLAQDQQERPAGSDFAAVAAAVTLMQQRQSGKAALESLVLART